MSNAVMKIGTYQLQNLLRHEVGFLYLDLSAQEVDLHPLLVKSRRIQPKDVLDVVRESVQSADYPIVLVCETGLLSEEAGRLLVENGYLNVFVIEGGIQGFDIF